MKRIHGIVFGLLLLLQNVGTLYALKYEVSPVVPDFMDLNKPWVTVTYGTTDNPFRDTGVIDGRHTVMGTPGMDPVIGEKLRILPAGVSRVIRLGNQTVGHEAESITYHFIADRERPLLLLNFAVILEDPKHPSVAQPRFIVQILDKNGNLVESCAEYNVNAGAGIKGFQEHNYRNSLIRWRDWTGVGLDLSAFAGEEVQLRFITYDCDYSGHFGYAYFYAECIPARLSLADCQGDRFELSAPGHFASYLWSNGQTDQRSEWLRAEAGNRITCAMASETGCHISMYAEVSPDGRMPGKDTLTYDTICQGQSYANDYFDLPVQDISRLHTATYVDVRDCDASREVKIQLSLNVIQQYLRTEDLLCRGDDYIKDGFEIRDLQPGIWRDTLLVSDKGKCPLYRVVALHVSPLVQPWAAITGDVTPCNNIWVNYRATVDSKDNRYLWMGPGGSKIVEDSTGLGVLVRFPDKGTDDVLKLKVWNGCGEYEACLPLDIKLSGTVFVKDSVCTGLVYQRNGFRIQPQNETGELVTINYGTSSQGCDSTTILELQVHGTPELKINTEDSVFCSPRELILSAQINGKEARRIMAVGDILCKDSTVVSPVDFPGSGKEACGVVFWLDKTGQHGWAVDVWEPGTGLFWGKGITPPLDYLGVFSCDALPDINGAGNTGIVLKSTLPEQREAFTAITYEPGWYMPALGQMTVLMGACLVVNGSMATVGGKPIRMQDKNRYWSSTLCFATQAWCLEFSDYFGWYLDYFPIAAPTIWARGIRDF